MAIADYATYVLKRNAPHQVSRITKATTAGPSAYIPWISMWTLTGLPAAGATPTTSVALDNTSTGAIGQRNPSSDLRLLTTRLSFSGNVNGCFLLYDRLNHQAGLSGTTTGAQTTNLPTAALTRHTGGDGVRIFIEIYGVIGLTATTITASYTNQAGTAGQTTPLLAFGGSAFRSATFVLELPLASGDTGVRSVESVTLAASTGTAGNFGVTLARPVALIPAYTLGAPDAVVYDALLQMGGCMPDITDGACLSLAWVGGGASGTVMLDLGFSED